MALLTKDIQERVVALLQEEGLLDAEKVAALRQSVEASKQPILAALISQKLTTSETITHATASVMKVPYVNLKNVKIEQDVLLNLPQDVAERSMAVPLSVADGRLTVAMLDVTNVQATDYLATLVKKPIRTVMASEDGIRAILIQYSSDFSSVKKAAQTSQEEQAQKRSANVKTITQDSPISKALTTILDYAAKSKASDIHIEPLENSLVIRCRIDGVLRQVMELPKAIEPALVSRIKILSNLKIDEHRVPQDGQFTVAVDDKEIDLRIAISPVVWGEQVVIRLLDKSGTAMEVEKMGMTGRALRAVLTGIGKPNGMILTSGPTGSGKSTTLYALIKKIKSEAINIVTLEDPVEYKMDGVNQIQVNVDAGLTFASGLRSILRQDPDVVMVGEIRDSETANLAVQAALTGHLVFSTLHTNSAAGILPRLLDMGIEPFLIASTLNTVIGQRLVRRVSDKKEIYQSSEMETKELNDVLGKVLPKNQQEVPSLSEDLGYPGLPVVNPKGYSLVKGVETKEAPGGYVGRAGLYEAIEVDEDIQKLIVARATAGDIMKVAKAKGCITMRQDGMLKALSGITTIKEVDRVASDLA
ncbi:MAG: Flp pilus assembly complex ATPase component TadA [Bacteroidaceae bacterium]|nr:Flp pilus assembly complex ATPase component TadA [Bacteroidaceae bacterium]MBR3595234.1 Flp pilus assembly complex ATPase component TadA [Candidatus Saccharibacteria bacterium]MBR6122743.1 Flp pilus assembly complex ATPase component TadA [Candidatus Saccharibacteria bacterium]